MTCDEAIKIFRQDGWILMPTSDSYESFLSLISHLEGDQFVKDFHVKNLLVFPTGSEFYRHPLYLDGTLILQDKASCLPPLLLNPEPNSTVLDMCSAPGMKTTMLSALMRGKGKIYACEINPRRHKDLEKMITMAGCSNASALLADSLEITENMDWFNDVNYILVDPSCSGTGMQERSRLFSRQMTEERTRKLASFQCRLLLTALTDYPNARRIVYSTCSLLTQENEDVVQFAFKRLAEMGNTSWTLANAMPEWTSRGSSKYKFGQSCLTASLEKDLTTGFFVAVFEKNADHPAELLTNIKVEYDKATQNDVAVFERNSDAPVELLTNIKVEYDEAIGAGKAVSDRNADPPRELLTNIKIEYGVENDLKPSEDTLWKSHSESNTCNERKYRKSKHVEDPTTVTQPKEKKPKIKEEFIAGTNQIQSGEGIGDIHNDGKGHKKKKKTF